MFGEEGGVIGAEGICGVEAPADRDGGDTCFLGGSDIADFIADVDHFGGVEGKGAGDRAQVFRFAREHRGRADEGEEVADAVNVEKFFDVVAGIGGEDAKAGRFFAKLGESFDHAFDEGELGDVFFEFAASSCEKDR